MDNQIDRIAPVDISHSNSQYHLRGEGMANYVIGFSRRNERMVWRIRKQDVHGRSADAIDREPTTRSVVETRLDDLELSLRYVREVIHPLFARFPLGEHLIAIPKRIDLRGEHLLDIEKESDVFSMSKDGRRTIAVESTTAISVLEMPDFTVYLPGADRSTSESPRICPDESTAVDSANRESTAAGIIGFPVIGLEIKPKQGFIPTDLLAFSNPRFAYCTNCLSQFEKYFDAGGSGSPIYDYCPLDLYSGDVERIKRAIRDLLDCPKTHLKIFRNGELVFGKNQDLTRAQIGRLLLDDDDGDGFETFVAALVRILRYDGTDGGHSDHSEGSILDILLGAQQLDQHGPLMTATSIEELQSTIDVLRSDPSDPYPIFFGDLGQLNDDTCSKLDTARHGLVCQTLRDCSIMITMQVFARDDRRSEDDDDRSTNPFRPFKLSDRLWLRFHTTVVDLDAKSPAKAIKYRRRLLRALELMKSDLENGACSRISCLERGRVE